MTKQRIREHQVKVRNLPLAPDDIRITLMEQAKGFVVETGNYASCSSVAIAAVAEFLAYHQGYRLR